MKGRFNFKLWALVALLSAFLLSPAVGQAQEEPGQFKEWKAKLAKELQLSPEKEAKFMAVADRYAKSRLRIYESLKKSQADLSTAMAAPKPEAAKVQGLVKAITTAQDKLLNSYKGERDAEMAGLSPLEQGRYLVILHQWRTRMYEKPGKEMEHQKGGMTPPKEEKAK